MGWVSARTVSNSLSLLLTALALWIRGGRSARRCGGWSVGRQLRRRRGELFLHLGVLIPASVHISLRSISLASCLFLSGLRGVVVCAGCGRGDGKGVVCLCVGPVLCSCLCRSRVVFLSGGGLPRFITQSPLSAVGSQIPRLVASHDQQVSLPAGRTRLECASSRLSKFAPRKRRATYARRTVHVVAASFFLGSRLVAGRRFGLVTITSDWERHRRACYTSQNWHRRV